MIRQLLLPDPALAPEERSRPLPALSLKVRSNGTRTAAGAAPLVAPILLPLLGLAAWIVGINQLHPSSIGTWGLLASANPWFLLAFPALVLGFLLELRRRARGWLLALDLIALIVAIHGSVPLIFGAPEYAWVYKHLGIISAFATYGHVTDPANIYQQWPALFAAVAALGSLAHVAPISLAAWAPLAFELADALLLFAIFRLVSGERRTAWLAILLYEGLVSWVGQDYLSPQAFAYLLSLAIVLITLRWLRRAPAVSGGRLARLRAPLVAGLPAPGQTTKAMRAVAVALLTVIYLAIVMAHQLTPYLVLTGIGALTILDLLRPRWLLALLSVAAFGYLVPHYHLIVDNFGGLFSGGTPIDNASGVHGTYHAGAEATTALVVRVLAGAMWLAAAASIAIRRKELGRVIIPAALAFSPFIVLFVQSYGGEAIYRVFLFSAPWCALLIAGALRHLRFPRRLPLRWPLTACVCLAALFAGLQGLYGPARVDAFTRSEVTASQWLYKNVPRGSLVLLPVDNFPALEAANYNDYDLQVMPSDPQLGAAWLDESNVAQVQSWIASLGHDTAYIVVSRSMAASAAYFGAPTGYKNLVSMIPTALGGSVVYHDADTTIYRLSVV
ncbi:MAG: hypothetical protein JOZ98_15055 [Solirubrobacterales bacterium]|nr:hypothetical protein [Solirubrobacterales bacterium]